MNYVHCFIIFFQKADSESRVGVIPNPSNNDENVIKINKIVFEAFKHEDKLNVLVKHLTQAIELNKNYIDVISSLPVRFKFYNLSYQI